MNVNPLIDLIKQNFSDFDSLRQLETAIEWIGDDELVEVTPKSIRIRKRGLSIEERRKSSKKG